MGRPTWVEISSQRLASNWAVLRELTPSGADLVAIMKADAYGHGAVMCSAVLVAQGAQWFGVTSVAEGLALRTAVVNQNIIVLSSPYKLRAADLAGARLTPVLGACGEFMELEQSAREYGLGPQALQVHLELDTGLSRQGARLTTEITQIARQCQGASSLQVAGVSTHFSAPDANDSKSVTLQIARFEEGLKALCNAGLRPQYIHAGASATMFRIDQKCQLKSLARKFKMKLLMRPGNALYGFAPIVKGELEQVVGRLRPVLSWKTRVTALKVIVSGDAVGYDSTFRAERMTCLALIPVGFADGLSRRLSNRGHALVRGRICMFVGLISMDQAVLDVTDASGVAVGDEVVLIGEQHSTAISAANVAEILGTIPDEITSLIADRVSRRLI